MLVLQQLFNLSDQELEFQVNDRHFFEEFVGLGVMNSIPDATTVAFFRDRLFKAGVIELVWADSAYSGEGFADLLSLGGFESLIHEKGARNQPFSHEARKMNRVMSVIRACVEHVFGCMTMSMGGKLSTDIENCTTSDTEK